MFRQTRLQVLEPSAGRWHPLPVSCSVAFLVGGPQGQGSFNNLPRVVNGKHLHDYYDSLKLRLCRDHDAILLQCATLKEFGCAVVSPGAKP